MDGIERRVADYYQSRSLSDSRLQAILIQSRRSRRRRYYAFYAAAAVIMIVMAGTMHEYALTSQRVTVALREAAMNHATKLQLDVEAQSLSELQLSLKKLPFDLVLPTSDLYRRLSLIGGRYCTISGNLAAHLKFFDPESGEHHSLFLTALAKNLKSMSSDAEQIAGVHVKLWQENDFVYAMARTASSVP